MISVSDFLSSSSIRVLIGDWLATLRLPLTLTSSFDRGTGRLKASFGVRVLPNHQIVFSVFIKVE
jgi:hypothetical protein